MVKKLIIIGNGFDRWAGLSTSYESFKQYYDKHVRKIVERLKYDMWEFVDGSGKRSCLSDVEVVYGDPLHPSDLDEGFWHKFEESLGYINAERLNLFFGKGKKNLRNLKKCVKRAHKILNEAYLEWISTINTDGECKHEFEEDCFFINFNYTDTLENGFVFLLIGLFMCMGRQTVQRTLSLATTYIHKAQR